jgi:hypothetical protein
MQNRWNYWIIISLLLAVMLLNATCASKGLVTDKYQEDYYRIVKLMPEGRYENNPTFIVYGDNQAGWRGLEKFIRQKNWATWKMAIFPFYQLYLLGNGMVGWVNWVRQVPDYGEQERRMVRDAIYHEVKRSDADFILSVGDITAHDGRRPSHWGLFLKENKEESPLLDEVPYLPTAGNHDRVNDAEFGMPNYQAVFDYPGFYVMDFPDVSLFVTDSNFMLDQKQEIDDDRQDELFKQWFVSGDPSAQPSWLERELQARKDVFKIVSFHHPLLSVAHHASDWTNPTYGRELEEKRKQLIELFKKENVHVVFSGHDHLYQHVVVRYETQASGAISNIHFVVSSGGGAPIRDRGGDEKEAELIASYREQGIDCSLVKIAETHHYCLVDVGPSSLTVQTRLVSEDANVSGALLDDLELKK